MKKHTDEIMNNLIRFHGATDSIVCRFFENSNECHIPDSQVAGPEIKSLLIMTHGGSRKEKIEIGLPSNKFYDIEEVEEDIFC